MKGETGSLYVVIDIFSIIPSSSHSCHFDFQSNSETVGPPPAPALKAQISPLANMFTQDIPRSPISVDLNSGTDQRHRSLSFAAADSARSVYLPCCFFHPLHVSIMTWALTFTETGRKELE